MCTHNIEQGSRAQKYADSTFIIGPTGAAEIKFWFLFVAVVSSILKGLKCILGEDNIIRREISSLTEENEVPEHCLS